jgi:colanic acid/amylovoran biosynthesis glycosyltransferase
VLAPREVAAQLAQADVLMAPSVVASDGDRESGVIALKEASAAGVAVLGTQHGGIPEIIDDAETGYLVAERDIAALSVRLAELLSDRALCERLGRAGRAKMEREYDVGKRVQELERLYDEAIALKPRRARPC